MSATVEYVRNKEPFATWIGTTPRVVGMGELISVDDPVYKGREHMFETVEEHATRGRERKAQQAVHVERATAAPGEKRPVQIPEPEQSRTAEEPDGYLCPIEDCDFVSPSTRGLNIHMRVHNAER